jgi:hypothetical protein
MALILINITPTTFKVKIHQQSNQIFEASLAVVERAV